MPVPRSNVQSHADPSPPPPENHRGVHVDDHPAPESSDRMERNATFKYVDGVLVDNNPSRDEQFQQGPLVDPCSPWHSSMPVPRSNVQSRAENPPPENHREVHARMDHAANMRSSSDLVDLEGDGVLVDTDPSSDQHLQQLIYML